MMSFAKNRLHREKKIIILGGGIIGITSAYYLAQSGYDVTVIEKNNDVAKESSFANGAQLCYSCIRPLYYTSISSKFLYFLEDFQVYFPYLSRLTFFKNLENYLINKALNHSLTDYRNNLFKQSAEEFSNLIQQQPLSFPHEKKGILQLFFKDQDFKRAIKSAEYKKENGIEFKILSGTQCVQKEPSLKFTKKNIQGGILMAKDGVGDAHLFTKALMEICKKLGVTILLNSEVEKFIFDDQKIVELVTKENEKLVADAYIVSLGANSKSFLAPLNINLSMQFIKGYSISIELDEQDTFPVIGIADPINEIFYAKLDNTLRVAGLTEKVGIDTSINQEKIEILIESVDNLFPQLQVRKKGKIHQWACLRPSASTKVPFIIGSKYNNLFINTGHGGYGWTLAPGSEKLVCELIKSKI